MLVGWFLCERLPMIEYIYLFIYLFIFENVPSVMANESAINQLFIIILNGDLPEYHRMLDRIMVGEMVLSFLFEKF